MTTMWTRLVALFLLVAITQNISALIVCRNTMRVHIFSHITRKRRSHSSLLCCSSKPPQNNDDEEAQFDSLDVLLDRARNRNKIPLLLGKVQSLLDRRVLPFLSIGDTFIVLVALVILNAKGFVLGLVLGRASLIQLRKIIAQQENGEAAMKVVDFYPVILAILLDQIL